MTTGVRGRAAAGHPVDVASGAVFNVWEDFVLPGRVPLAFRRHYNTALLDRPPGPLGPGWTHDLALGLRETDAECVFDGPAGGEVRFARPAGGLRPGEPVRNLGAFAEVVREAAADVVITWDVDAYSAVRYVFPRGGGPVRAVEDVTGQGIDLEYDRHGRLAVARQRREGRAFRFGYDQAGRLVQVAFVPVAGDERAVAAFGYAGNRLTTATDPLGHPVQYEYDGDGRMTRETTRSGGVFTFRYDARGRCVRATGLDDYDRRDLVYHDAAGMTAVADSTGAVGHYFWNALGQVTQAVGPLGSTSGTKYDEHARVVEELSPNGGVTKFEYDAAGNRSAVIDPLGRVSVLLYNARRQVTTFLDPAGGQWRLSYDERGNLTGTETALGERWAAVVNPHGEVTEAIDPLGSRLRARYADRGDLQAIDDWEGHTTRYECNEYGWIRQITDPLGRATEFAYDPALRVTAITRPDGSVWRYGYTPGGHISLFADAAGNVTRYRYGTCGRMTEQVDPLGNTVRFGWASEPGRLQSITNEEAASHKFEYDAEGRLAPETGFNGRRTEYKYGPGYTLLQVTANGQITAYERDLLDRVVAVTEPDGRVAEFEYDALGNLVRGTDPSGTVTLARDPVGRVVREVRGEYAVASRYDPLGNRTERASTLGPAVRYHYDRNQNCVGLTAGDRPITRLTRDAAGGETARRLAPGLTLEQTYDRLGRLASQHLGLDRPTATPDAGFRPADRPVVRREYEYARDDTLAAVTDDRWGRSEFRHDTAGRLTGAATPAGDEAFEYDGCGNVIRISRATADTPTPTAVDLRYAPGNELVGTTHSRVEYDAADRPFRVTRTADGDRVETWQFAWGGDGMLSGVERPDRQKWSYEYDVFGRRTAKVGPPGRTEYHWDGDQIAHVRTPDGRLTHWLSHPDWANPAAKMVGDDVWFCVTDLIGTLRELVSGAGQVAWADLPAAWGGSARMLGQDDDCPPRFPGQWHDPETGLHYNRFRYYDPQTGRYLTPDPAGLTAGFNAFRYVPSPLTWLDPFGLDTTTTDTSTGRTYTFTQDNYGRTTSAEGPVCNPNRLGYEHRDEAAQRRVSGGTGFHAGHLIANTMGGPGGDINLVKMCPNLNLSAWKRMENQIVGLTRNNSVRMRVEVTYRGNTRIPMKFTVTATITDRNGKTTTQTWVHKNCNP